MMNLDNDALRRILAQERHQSVTLSQQADNELIPAPEFDRGIFPEPYRSYLDAASAAIGVPPETIAIPILVNIGGLIGNRLAVLLKRGFVQYPALWAAVVAEPGTAKTPALNAARALLDALQGEWWEHYQHARVQYDADLSSWENVPKSERGAKPVAPVLRSAFTTDATLEALVLILTATFGLTLQHDEIETFVRSMNQYRAGADKQRWMSMWASAPLKVDRRTGDSVYIRRPVVGVTGGIQPDLLQKLHTGDGSRDGFIDRLILIRPEVRRRGWSEDETDPALLEAVVCSLRSLDARLNQTLIDSEVNEVAVLLHPDAKRQWAYWYDGNGAEIEASTGLRAGFLSKLPLQVARCALILHAMANIDDPRRMISAETMNNAIWLGGFFVAHWDRCLPLLGGQVANSITRLPARIMRILNNPDDQDLRGWVARATLSKRLGNVLADDLSDALASLLADGGVEHRIEPTATKPREEWRVSQDSRHWGNSNFPTEKGDSPNNPNVELSIEPDDHDWAEVE